MWRLLPVLFLVGFSQAQAAPYPMKCLMEHELAHAGGWGADHPGGVLRKGCGALPMPPHKFPLPKGAKAHIEYHTPAEILWRCPGAVACSQIGGMDPWVWLPRS